MQEQAAKQLRQMIADYSPLDIGTLEVICTYRRLACKMQVPGNISTAMPSIKGPPVSAGYMALQKFMDKNGLDSDTIANTIAEVQADAQNQKITAIEIRDSYYYIPETQKTTPIQEHLLALSRHILENFHWPKSMKWIKGSDFRWVRPIYSIVSMLDDQTLPLQLHHIKANNITYTDQLQPIVIRHASSYDASDNRKQIVDEAVRGKSHTGLGDIDKVAEQPHPFFIKVDFPLPDLYAGVVLQDYVYIKDDKSIMLVSTKPIVNTDACENLIKARMQDMLDLLNKDLKADPSSWQEGLKHIPFCKGSLHDKVQRIYQIYTHESVLWFKADLCSLVVYEHPVLAKKHMQHLKPELNIVNDPMLTLLDDLDSLVQFFLLKVPVSSSQDPYGLKRFALSVIEHGCKIDRLADLPKLIGLLGGGEISDKLVRFLQDRMRAYCGLSFNTRESLDTNKDELYTENPDHTFWRSQAKTASWNSCDTALIEHTYKRLSNFVKNKPSTPLTKVDTTAEHLLPLLNLPDNLDALHAISKELEVFFDNNLVLDPGYLKERLGLLFALKSKYDLLVPQS